MQVERLDILNFVRMTFGRMLSFFREDETRKLMNDSAEIAKAVAETMVSTAASRAAMSGAAACATARAREVLQHQFLVYPGAVVAPEKLH